jgi:hypothetical protein
LHDSPIEDLYCAVISNCGIESIEIDRSPKHLKFLNLEGNCINADGCHGLATLLRGGGAVTLTNLWLGKNMIDDK